MTTHQPAPITTDSAPTVEGFVAPGFEPLRAAFERNFTERGELGAAFAVMRDGAPLVDLWGGVADVAAGRRWEAETIQIIYSGSKGLVSACMLLLLQRGLLELDVPVARYWPEFAQAGKEGVAVRDVVAHTARLPGLEVPVTWQEATDARRMADLLAAQPQNDDPRAAACYHAMTFGWLCGELVRRVDGRTIGRFFAEEFAQPLDLDLWIGLPAEQESRVAPIHLSTAWGATPEFADDALSRSVFGNPSRHGPEPLPVNERAWRAAEIPASNAIGTARSIARFYDGLERFLAPDTLDLGRRPISTRMDSLRHVPDSFGVGFQLQTETLELGPPADAFGHGGAGGSRHARWPTQRLGYSYATNLLADVTGDIRGPALLEALYGCLEAERER